MLIEAAIPGARNAIKKEGEKILKYKDLIIEMQGMWNVKAAGDVECESRSDTGNNGGNWNHFRITQKIPEQHTGKARN